MPLRGADERRAETPFASPAVLHAAPRGDLLSADIRGANHSARADRMIERLGRAMPWTARKRPRQTRVRDGTFAMIAKWRAWT